MFASSNRFSACTEQTKRIYIKISLLLNLECEQRFIIISNDEFRSYRLVTMVLMVIYQYPKLYTFSLGPKITSLETAVSISIPNIPKLTLKSRVAITRQMFSYKLNYSFMQFSNVAPNLCIAKKQLYPIRRIRDSSPRDIVESMTSER